MAIPALIIWLSLLFDRVSGDPPNRYHPVAWLGRFIALWGSPEIYPAWLQRLSGVIFSLLTAVLFTLPFLLFDIFTYGIIAFIAGAVLLKICLALRCLEEHVESVTEAVEKGDGRSEAGMLVSRNTSSLSEEELLSAAYESMAENLVDSVISPLFYYTMAGLGGAAFFRAYNTMDAMLGYKDDRRYLGWFPARMDDLLNFIPARIAGLSLIIYFFFNGSLKDAWLCMRRDARKRPGINGGIPMALIAGGTGIRFEKPGCYTIGDPVNTLAESGKEIVKAVRYATVISALIFSAVIVLSGDIVLNIFFRLM
ncbi:adenosylcobinamide-phosphate synthase CbiB [Methanoplanus limicola]|uniref:Probable cobalamin biosynthesis protein CobD n=1 Tax=Methanoplanus limicola DSM 2279 TaxID=937775 RepID=H1Z1V7_9EURY|nr:adenosylcobinamide-phosphate synthase CbiB [Methanoplanus limicola]EHQ35424.1 adenosylcobinamide-phosphate synthase [Methanoplanus limicola DSM 2279]